MGKKIYYEVKLKKWHIGMWLIFATLLFFLVALDWGSDFSKIMLFLAFICVWGVMHSFGDVYLLKR